MREQRLDLHAALTIRSAWPGPSPPEDERNLWSRLRGMSSVGDVTESEEDWAKMDHVRRYIEGTLGSTVMLKRVGVSGGQSEGA